MAASFGLSSIWIGSGIQRVPFCLEIPLSRAEMTEALPGNHPPQ